LLLEGRSGFVWSGKLIRAEAALALFGGALALPLYDWLLQRMESFQLTASQWVIAVAGIGEGLLLERQPPGWRMLAGAALVLASLAALLAARPEDEAMLTLRSTPPRS
jgi:drug/metabolite transporter (DMT)-like permease